MCMRGIAELGMYLVFACFSLAHACCSVLFRARLSYIKRWEACWCDVIAKGLGEGLDAEG
jgi:hypothetical protein